MSAREAMLAAIWALREREDEPTGGEVVDAVLAALCPPGGRVVVSRESKPCDKCDGKGKGTQRYTVVACEAVIDDACLRCGGSGVVEATTIHGLEATSTDRDGVLCDELGRVLTDQTVPLFRAVALPEDGQ